MGVAQRAGTRLNAHATECLKGLAVGDGLTPYVLEDALPEIIAVVEAAEASIFWDHVQDELRPALEALEAKLGQRRAPSDSPFPQPALEAEEKGLGRDREIPGKP